MVSRREFLTQAAIGSGVLCLGNAAPPLWARAAAAAPAGHEGRMLVVIELEGGNDGLNTVVPYADDTYHRNRPTLGIAANQVLKLDDRLGLHPAMTAMAKLWESGRLRIVNNVGYPSPNRSHSHSLEIWRSGALPTAPSGWLGRVADQHRDLSLCHVGDGAIPLAVRQQIGAAMSIRSFDDFHLRAGAQITTNESYAGDSTLAQVAARLEAAAGLAERMKLQTRPRGALAAVARAAEGTEQPTPLAQRLEVVRALIEQEAGFRIFYTGTTGFDTHVNQAYRHRRLLTEVSEALWGFLHRSTKAASASECWYSCSPSSAVACARTASRGPTMGPRRRCGWRAKR